jgi:glycosyltransferase involved in cell wall biosynthesis
MKKMDGVIAISKYLYDYYKQYTSTIFVPPTVDLNDAKWNRERVLEHGEIIKLVYAGSAGFGLKDRLDTIVKSVIKFPNMQFDIIGMTQEQYEVGYGHMLERYQNIIFHGRIPHQEAVQAVQAADFQFLIRDSNLKNDAGFPTKFVESLACCTPVIATLTSNIGDYLTDGYNGYVVDDNQTLDEVLLTISQLTKQEIVQMKKHCRKCRLFDYREYKYTFEQIFG